MKNFQIVPLAAIGLVLLAFGFQPPPSHVQAQQTPATKPASTKQKPVMRYFLLSSRPNHKAWQVMKKNPGDRQAATAGAMKKIGCEMLGYYWGLGNGRNYIIVAVPDNNTIQAMLVQRLSSGLLHEYEAIELVRSSDMVAMFERLKELDAADDSLPK